MSKVKATVGVGALFASLGCGAVDDAGGNDRTANAPVPTAVATTAAARAAGIRAEFLVRTGDTVHSLVPSGERVSFERSAGRIVPVVDGARTGVTVRLPERADAPFEIENDRVALGVQLLGASPARGEVATDMVVYGDSVQGGALFHVPVQGGTEEFVRFEARPAERELRYEVTLRGVAGLRLVDGVLEFLRAGGDPALRTKAPLVVDSTGQVRQGTIAVEGCAVDTLGNPPWGRPTTPPGSNVCTVRTAWSDEGLTYPVLVDPAWTSAGSMATARHSHRAAYLDSSTGSCASGCVLVTGGVNASGVLSSAELYNVTTGTWSVTDPMQRLGPSGIRVLQPVHSHAALSLGATVLVAGGATTTATIPATAVTLLFDPTATPVWSYKGVLPGGARSHLAGTSFLARTTTVTSVRRTWISGGYSGATGSAVASNAVDVYTGTWAPGPELFKARAEHAMGGGQPATTPGPYYIGVAGGAGANDATTPRSVEVWNTAVTWTEGGQLSTGMVGPAYATIGTSLRVGGGKNGTSGTSSVDFISLITGDVSAAAPLSNSRAGVAAALYGSSVLFAGGYTPGLVNGSSRAADLVTSSSSSPTTMLTQRALAQATTLASNGKVLVTGGYTTSRLCLPPPNPCNTTTTYHASAEIFDQLGAAQTCTGAGDCKSGNCVDGFCCNNACAGACQACSVAAGSLSPDGTCGVTKRGTPGGCSGGILCDGVSTSCQPTCAADDMCPDTHFCNDDGECIPVKTVGSTCGIAQCLPSQPGCRQCGANACVDGYCCNSACAGSCEACSAALSVGPNGTCSAVKKDTVPTPACASGGNLCDGVTRSCPGKCVNDSSCAATKYCNLSTGDCVDKKAPGAACVGANECVLPGNAPGYCVDGVCCDTSCAGTCRACVAALTGGANGKCANATAGTDPHENCSLDSPTTCGQTGQCSGAGSCAFHNAAQVCGAPACVGSTHSALRVCAAPFTCSATGALTACYPFTCQQASGQCYTGCNSDAECDPTTYCTGGACVQKQSDGASCGAGRECANGYCADGVCCDTACNGPCQACTAQKKGTVDACATGAGDGGARNCDGTCGDIAAGTDPDDECTAESPTTCGRNGQCRGGECDGWPQGTDCSGSPGLNVCSGNKVVGKVCPGDRGICQNSIGGIDCAPLKCLNGSCAACVTTSDCLNPVTTYCDASGQCVPRKELGASCTAADQCVSTHCADGVCCGEVCNEQCEWCGDPAQPGVCLAAPPGAPQGGRDACDGDGTCGGTCDGLKRDGCSYAGAATECTEARCQGDWVVTAGTCDGSGGCAAGVLKDCGGYTCDPTSNACSTACTTKQDCRLGAVCDTSSGTGTCNAAGATCDGGYNVKDTDGTVSSCNGYSCVAGQCQQQCGAGADCAAGHSCVGSACVLSPVDGGVRADAGPGAGSGGTTLDAGAGGAGVIPTDGGAPGAGGSAGGTNTPDSGSVADAATGGGILSKDSGGCGCRTAKTSDDAASRLAMTLVALGLAAARRRARASGSRPRR